jgi:tetratricopeptide (TPR) repeat protein
MPLALSRPKLWIGLAVASLGGACLAGGWWLGHLQSGGLATDPKQRALERQLEGLQQRSAQGGASAAEEQRLLELLIALNRKDEALSLSERLADQQPERPALRLVLAELRRDQNDRSGAEREVRQLLNQNPNNIEALQLMALLQVESGRGALAVSQLQAAFDQANKPALKEEAPKLEAPKLEAPKPELLDIGLLLANVLQRQGQPGQAEALLIRLANAFPKDQTPILARALLLQERGNTSGAQAAIAQARALKPGKEDPRLDAIATAWGLESLKGPSPGGSRSAKPGTAKNPGP